MATTVDRIIIIDVDEKRAGRIRESFLRLGCAVTCVWKSGTEVLHDPETEALPDQCLVLFHHVGDLGKWPVIQSVRTIYYSGKEPEGDSRFPADVEERIYRPVTREAGAPDLEEAREILAYVRAIAEGGGADRPALLEPRRSPRLLRALAILCQGYLFLHAVRGLETKEIDELLDRAVARMGWKPLLAQQSYRHLLPPDLPTELERVSHPSWWLRSLREEAQASGGEVARGAAWRRGLQREWDQVVRPRIQAEPAQGPHWKTAWEAIDKLTQELDNHRDGVERTVRPSVVAGAYCALADVLGVRGDRDHVELAAAPEPAQP